MVESFYTGKGAVAERRRVLGSNETRPKAMGLTGWESLVGIRTEMIVSWLGDSAIRNMKALHASAAEAIIEQTPTIPAPGKSELELLIKCSTCFWLFSLRNPKKQRQTSKWLAFHQSFSVFQSPFPLIFIGIMSGHPHLSTSSWVNVPPCLFRGSKHSLRRGSSAHRNEEMGKSLKGHKGPIICIYYIYSTYINIYIYISAGGLTYPIPAGTFEDDFHLARWAYLWLVSEPF